MAETRPLGSMDPPHITEFASDRYFEKLNQRNANLQQADPSDHGTTTLTTTISSHSRFILPLREHKLSEVEHTKPADQKRDKGRFFSIRQKVSQLHSKFDSESSSSQTRASIESARKR